MFEYNIRNKTLEWFKPYFDKRSQKVSVAGKLSSSLPIASGVPQCSLLGPYKYVHGTL